MSMQVFQKKGSYGSAVVHTNVVLHREAADALCREIRTRFPEPPTVSGTGASAAPLRVLDLACGGEPLSIASALAALSPRTFEYTGVDLSADQAAKAKGFPFPPNVVRAKVLQGSAWVLGPVLPKGEQFDVVFCGLNTHHGTPEEAHYLALQLRSLLRPGGLFLNHDVYRREGFVAYERRPQRSEESGESFVAVPEEALAEAGAPDLGLVEFNPEDPAHHSFRAHFLARFEAALLAKGCTPEETSGLVRHVALRDFPLSVSEMSRAFKAAGFQTAAVRYEEESEEPLKDCFCMFIAWPSEAITA